jgi:hypothetical protein
MSSGVTIATIVVSAVTAVFVIGLFIWGAVKDGDDQHARDAKVQRRSWPGPE